MADSSAVDKGDRSVKRVISRRRVPAIVALGVVAALLVWGVFAVRRAVRIRAIAAGLSSDETEVRAAAVDKLSRENPRSVVFALLPIVREGWEGNPAWPGAIEVLAAHREVAIPILIEKEFSAKRPEWLEWLEWPLGENAETYGFINAAQWIVWREGQAAIGPLRGRLSRKDAEIRGAALDLLGRIDGDNVTELLMDYLNDPYDSVRSIACIRLGWRGDRKVVVPLMDLFTSEKEASVRVSAVYALGRLKDPRAVDFLLAATRDGNEAVRAAAARALGMIGDKRVEARLLELLADKDAEVVNEAIAALGRAGGPKAVEVLLKRFPGDTWSEKATIIRSLGYLGDKRAVGPLLALLNDPAYPTRFTVAHALVSIGASGEAGKLIQAFESETYGMVHPMLAVAIDRTGDPEAREYLRRFGSEEEIENLARTYRDAIKAGRDEDMVPLALALWRHGDMDMAVDFGWSDHVPLCYQGQSWRRDNGHRVPRGDKGHRWPRHDRGLLGRPTWGNKPRDRGLLVLRPTWSNKRRQKAAAADSAPR